MTNDKNTRPNAGLIGKPLGLALVAFYVIGAAPAPDAVQLRVIVERLVSFASPPVSGGVIVEDVPGV